MRILIHCNGGPSAGAGHVVRSAALAEEAVASGHQVTVVGRIEGEHVRSYLDLSGVELVALTESEHPGAALARLVGTAPPDVVHLDSYDTSLRRSDLPPGPSLVSNIHDGTFGRRAADVCIDPNLGAESAGASQVADGVHLLGPRYAPLRRSVTGRRGRWQAREPATRVLVVMGGSDPNRLTPRVLRLLDETRLATRMALEVTAIAGAGVAEETAAAARELSGLRVRLLPPVDDLPALMVEQDLVVSAAGTTVWELCCLGVPMALVCAVDNQRPGYEQVVAAGAAVGLGSLDADLATRNAEALRALLASPAARAEQARRAAGVVDGRGAWRVVRAWEQLIGRSPSPSPRSVVPLRVRPAAMDDAQALWHWRNDPGTRAASRDGEPVAWEDHVSWLRASLGREDRLLLVVSDPDGDVGTVRWDRHVPGVWEVSLTVAPERRGRSLAGRVLEAGERELARATGGPTLCLATVAETNAASRRLFAAAGYLPDSPADGRGFLTVAKQLPGPSV